jgi:iron-sulfur cluster repair protein YtfE (RIC family)
LKIIDYICVVLNLENMGKPLKRHSALIPLSQDHHFGLLLAWKIRKGLKVGFEKHRIADYLEYFFKSHLEPHFEMEEKYLFPYLPEEDPYRKRAELEHRDLRTLQAEISSHPQGGGEMLSQFADELEAHIRFEERELFEHMQEALNPKELKELEGKIQELHHKVEDTWEDQFWN